ncbi:MAG: hypothetical protein H8E31_11695 [Planctomycetes bacterium]|nr:hypothetical protein [Planctomycetota bacterium]
MRLSRILTVLLLLAVVLPAGCFNSSGSTAAAVKAWFKGQVVGTAGEAVPGATVYLVPASSVSTTPITAASIRSGASEGYDEPLEDLVAASGAGFTQAVTGANGRFHFNTVPDGSYFVYIEAVGTEYLPGGSWCRDSVNATGLRAQDVTLTLSSSPSAAATFVGMSTCLGCHAEYATEKGLAHRLGFTVPGQLSNLQTLDEHPELFDGLGAFTDAAVYTGGTPVYHYDLDTGRGFDKFKTSLTDPSGTGGTVYAILWLWKDTGSGTHKITFENVITPADPLNLMEREVKLLYGGAVYKQRYMIEWPGRNALYPVLQFQSAGNDARYDRTRKEYRDYHLDFYWNSATDTFKAPDVSKNISRNCIGCHATGFTQSLDGGTGEVVCDSVEDVNGEYDIDGDGLLNDMNIGCETCHGAGSEHVAALEARFIITPENLSPSRAVMTCQRCHDRLVGAGPLAANDHPMSAAGVFAPAGISRAEYLATYTTTKGPTTGQNWQDDIHAKSHHQQGPDFLKSLHYRNPDELVTCDDCHDMHGGTGYRRALIADPDDSSQPLCQTCHEPYLGDMVAHTEEMTGQAHGAAVVSCVHCHMPKTAKTGSGTYGLLLGAPTGTSTDPGITYFENDITSHVFDVPSKTNVGVAGVLPGSAMPIPYTDNCGTCHDAGSLQYSE